MNERTTLERYNSLCLQKNLSHQRVHDAVYLQPDEQVLELKNAVDCVASCQPQSAFIVGEGV